MLIQKYTQVLMREFNLSEEDAKDKAMVLLGFVQHIASSEIAKYVEEAK